MRQLMPIGGDGMRSASRPAKRSEAGCGIEALEPRVMLTLLSQQLFPADNPWNQRITDAPVAANSAAIMGAIINSYGDGQLHPDFSQDNRAAAPLYGIPYNVVHGNSTGKVQVVLDAYPGESDPVPAPIPANAVIEGDQQNGPTVGVNNRGDSHLLVWDEDNNVAYEFYRASRPGENADGKWHADGEAVWDMKVNTFRTLGWTSVDAAGLSVLAGLVRPDEGLPVSQGGQGVINHAIRFTLQNAVILDQFIYPASHTANPGNNNPAIQPPMGARFRLKANVDISSLNPQSKILAQAMKDYGLIVADNGSNFFFTGASASVDANNQFALTWSDADVQDTVRGMKSLHFSDFEVVDLRPAVSAVAPASAAVGAQVTITGRNFSGAAGRLQVLFGTVPATSLTVVDDAHVTAVVPAGVSGTVDVRVKSGIDDPNDPDNINSPVWGYGISAISPAGRFTLAAANQVPTIATPAAANPNPVTGTTTALSVLGADDGGAANLTYTWAATAVPTGAPAPTFSANGTNAAKNATATFARAGQYTFTATVSDGALGATSAVNVTVNPTASGMTLSPAFTSVRVNGTRQFTASANDQFGQPIGAAAFAWSVVGGGGTINAAGLYTAPAGAGSAIVQAQSGAASARATVNILPPGGPVALITTGADRFVPPHVKSFDAATGSLLSSFWAYELSFTGGVRVGAIDLGGDGQSDILAAPGPGRSPLVRIYDGLGGVLRQEFMAFDPGFLGGLFVAAGDVNGDGTDDVVAAADAGAGPHVKVFSGADGSVIRSFFAYDPGFLGGVRVAAGDVNGDGKADLITGSGSAGPHVKVFDAATGATLASFFAYDPGYLQGIFVTTGDVDGDGRDEVLTGTSAGPGHVKAFAMTSFSAPAAVASFFAYDPAHPGGVRVAAVDTDGDGTDEILTTTSFGELELKVFAQRGTTVVRQFFAYAHFAGGVFVGGAA